MIEDRSAVPGRRPPSERADYSIRPRQPRKGAELRDSFGVVWRRRWSILLVTFVVTGLAVWLSSRQTPIYESRASVLVEPVDLGAASEAPDDLNMATESQLMASTQVAEIAARRLGITADPRILLDDLTVEQEPDTEILEVRYRAPDPARAQRLASAFARSYLGFRKATAIGQIEQAAEDIQREIEALEARLLEVQRQIARLPVTSFTRVTLEAEATSINNLILERQLEMSFGLPDQVMPGRVIQPATLPSSPVNPGYAVAVALGVAIGAVVGIGLAFLRERLSQRLRSSEEAEDHLGAPVLGMIPRVPQWHRRSKPMLITLTGRGSPAAEAYRILRTSVVSVATEAGVKSIVVTSAHRGEGKSATVANLGVVLARADKRVVLVSADLRRPRLHQFFQGDGAQGLSDVLAGRLSLGAAVHEIRLPRRPDTADVSSGRLRILPSGPVPEGPAELLTPDRVSAVLRALEEMADIVLIDAPPLLPVTDALVLAQVADGVLVILGPSGVERSSVSVVRQRLDKVGAHVIGAVLNGPDAHIAHANYSYY
jgi:succinoglycan biosynthesis transport protein ExoP